MSLLGSFSLGNIYYLSTFSPDFVRYKMYIDYFIIDDSNVTLEQGFVYFLFTSFFVFIRLKNFSILSEDAILNVGNKTNFSYLDLTPIEASYNLGIQEANFILYLVGLIGFYKFLKLHSYSAKHIFITFSVLNLLPVLMELRLTLKPEILAFSFLPWLLFSIEKYLETKKYIYIAYSSIFFSVLLTTKASIALMVSIFLLVVYRQHLLQVDNKIIFVSLILILLLTTPQMLENSNITGSSFLNRSENNLIFDQNLYDNKAPITFLYNVNFKQLVTQPISNYHADSLIGITLLDSFGDYFNLYWNQDYSLLRIDRKQFINSDILNNFYYDSEEDTVYIPKNYNFNLEYLRIYLSILMTIFFYGYIFIKIYKKDAGFKFYLGPLIGILVLLISSFGIPENNFNPLLGDTLKVFYYGFLFSLVFMLAIISLLKKGGKISMLLVLSLIPLFLFIFGFPKANNTYLDYSISTANQYSLLCKLNIIPLENMLLETQTLDCSYDAVEQTCQDLQYKNFLKKELVEIFQYEQEAYSYTSIEDCINKLRNDYEILTIKYQVQKIPILNLFTLLLSCVSILSLILNNKILTIKHSKS
jgi:hypothetical protein